MTTPIRPVILRGGSGTQLWPFSRAGFPMQFLCLTGDESLLQLAAKRLAALGADDIAVSAPPLIVSNEDHRFLALEQLCEAGIALGAALLEPIGRNTAPALTLAALAAVETGTDPILVVTPADQTVADQPAFTAAMRQAITEAATGAIVILGIAPDRPETGYGYIKTAVSPAPTLTVEHFVEKPDAATARRYLDEGGYRWNASMFVLKASVWIKALEHFRPYIAQVNRLAWEKRSADQSFVRPGKAEFTAIPAEFVDDAVMEYHPGSDFPIKMIPLDAGWSDLGAWDAVWQVLQKDGNGDAHLGDVLGTNSRNTLVHTTSRLVCLIGVQYIFVIDTLDAVLVADRSRSKDVKAIVAELHANGREEHTLHRKVLGDALSFLTSEQSEMVAQ